MKVGKLILTLFLCALLLCACAKPEAAPNDIDLPAAPETETSKETDETNAQGETGDICVILGDAASADSLQRAIGAQEYASFSGMTVLVRGLEGNGDAECAELVKSVLNDAPAALCLAARGGEQTDEALAQAKSAGVKVVICADAQIKNADARIIPVTNELLGASVMDALAEAMGEKGSYTVFVSSADAKDENETARGAIEHQREVYPDMELLNENAVCGADSDEAYKAVRTLLESEDAPEGVAFVSAAATQGAARAVDELDMKHKVFAAGVGTVSESAGLLQNGFVSALVGSEPSLDIQAACALARLLLSGEGPSEHTDLGVVGYNDLSAVGENTFAGNNLSVNASGNAA